MDPALNIQRDTLTPTLRRYAEVMDKRPREVLRLAAKGIARRMLVDLTPPAGNGVKGTAARRRGSLKISRDISKVVTAKRLKGRRLITHVFGRKLARPIYVPTRELYPDAHGAFRRFQKQRVRRVVVVDAAKVKALHKTLSAHVGRLMSGWVPIAAALDVPVAAWVAVHGTSRGAARLALGGNTPRIVMINRAPGLPPRHHSETVRRLGYALEYQRKAMIRAMDYVVMKEAKAAGFVTTRNPPPAPALDTSA
ncbi:MAG TPA: hypothetical protein VHF69_11635 [Candidatus Synoicihabitans sp.]|nr:hypothetical protein [Candidatus Synoicihabitans sp.]